MSKNHTNFSGMVKLKNACIINMMKRKYSTQDVDTESFLLPMCVCCKKSGFFLGLFYL